MAAHVQLEFVIETSSVPEHKSGKELTHRIKDGLSAIGVDFSRK